jgi:uncharacterized protein YqeY
MLIQKISKDTLEAAKAGNALKRDLLRLLKGTLDQGGTDPSDEEVTSAIKKIIKSNNLTTESMTSVSDRENWSNEWKDSYSKLIQENEILGSYLPTELGESEVRNILSELDLKACKSLGQAVGMAMKVFESKSLPVNPDLVKSVVDSIYN